MNRSSRILGLMAAVVCAFSALFAPAASAQEFTASEYPATISGSQVGEQVFTIENGLTVTCPTAVYSGEIVEQTGEIKGVTAKYGNEEAKCKVFGIVNATVKMNGCTYTLDDEANIENGMYHQGSADVVCPGSNKITITAGTCEVQVGSQVELGSGLDFIIITSSPWWILIIITTIEEELAYNKTKDGLFCPLNGTGEKTDGSVSGEIEATGESGGGSVSLGLTP